MSAIAKRWRAGEQRWVAPGEVFRPDQYSVDAMPQEAPARRFIEREHYSGSFPAARLTVGLFGPGAALLGVAVFSVPMSQRVLPKYCGTIASCELGRFVCRPEVAYNGETWFLARAFRLLALEKGIKAVVSFADPLEWRAGAIVVKPAHWGTIYQASNALLAGRSTARTHMIAPDGRVVSPRTLSKIRNGERGWRYGTEQLVAHGAPQPTDDETPAEWLQRSGAVFARRKHPGNLAYVFGLTATARNELRALHRGGLPYPKREQVAA